MKAERRLQGELEKEALNKAADLEITKPLTGLSMRESDNSISAKGSGGLNDGQKDGDINDNLYGE